jgi:hypothetical protein
VGEDLRLDQSRVAHLLRFQIFPRGRTHMVTRLPIDFQDFIRPRRITMRNKFAYLLGMLLGFLFAAIRVPA